MRGNSTCVNTARQVPCASAVVLLLYIPGDTVVDSNTALIARYRSHTIQCIQLARAHVEKVRVTNRDRDPHKNKNGVVTTDTLASRGDEDIVPDA